MLPSVPASSTIAAPTTISELLPHDKMYTLIVAGQKFHVSGASLSYDSPSTFTNYFLKNCNETTLSIDRSAKVFEKILLHLQGYSIQIEDDFDWVYLLSESTFYGLQKLKERLFTEGIIVNISSKVFKIPREIFTRRSGNHPNLFTLVYNNIVNDPLLSTSVFTRPPPFSPIVTNRNPGLFQELLNGLYGNEIDIRNEEHRKDLIRDCKYYQFFELEQRLIHVNITRNPFTTTEEIVIKFNDIKNKGLLNDAMNNLNQPFSRVKYSRPHIDKNHWRDLVVQFDSTDLNIVINPALNFCQLNTRGGFGAKLRSFITEISDDYNFDENTNGMSIYCDIESANGVINGMKMEGEWINLLKGSINNDPNKLVEIKLLKSQWRINVTGRNKLWMNCVKFVGVLDESHFNEAREFL